MFLQNQRLQITFAPPEKLLSQRFDKTAVIAQVCLDGKHTFCTSEQIRSNRRTTNGIGLCGEFVLAGAAEATKAAEWFFKPGIGLLRQIKPGASHDIWRTYPLQTFPVTASENKNGVLFQQKAIPCGGYGIDIEKAFHLDDNRIILDITVGNTGVQPVYLQEYQHNFLSLGGMPISKGYILEIPCDQELTRIEQETLRQGDEARLPSAVRVHGNCIYWENNMDEKIVYHRSEQIDPEQPWRWTLRHSDSNLSVSEETSFCPTRIDVWAVEHCICPEFYYSISLNPGEKSHWQRIWTFEG